MFKRNRYNYDFRLECVKTVLDGKHSILSLCKERGLCKTNLRLWIKFYEYYGPSGLLPRRRQCYDVSFKLDVLTAIDRECLSLGSACVRFNIPSESIIIGWQKAYLLHGEAGLLAKPKGRPTQMKNKSIKGMPKKPKHPLTREEELLHEIELLKLENEVLKKYNALVQAHTKRKS